MKKLFLIPAFIILFSGAKPGNMETVTGQDTSPSVPVNTKLDSINLKVSELNTLIQQL